MAQTRSFDVTLKNQPNAPRSLRMKGYEFQRGRTLPITNVADADYFDANPEFQVVETTGKASAEKPAAPKGRFSRMAPPAPAPEEAAAEDDEIEDEGELDEPAEESPELDEALAPKKAKGGKKQKQ